MPAPLYRRVLVVANPVAGRGRGAATAMRLRDQLAERGADVELFLTSARGSGAERLRRLERGTDLVVAVGGDGTVAEVLSELPTTVPLAVLPMGTANVLSLDLGLPRSAEGLLRTLGSGRATEIDVAQVNGRVSFLVTGVGFDGEIVRDVERRRAGPIRKWTYVRAGLVGLARYSAPELWVELDGRRLERPYGWVLVSNMIGYGGVIELWRGRRLDDGLYEVFLFDARSRWQLVAHAVRGLLRRLPGRSCRMEQARHVRIESAVPVPYEVDGDFGGETPVEIEVLAGRHRLLLPW